MDNCNWTPMWSCEEIMCRDQTNQNQTFCHTINLKKYTLSLLKGNNIIIRRRAFWRNRSLSFGILVYTVSVASGDSWVVQSTLSKMDTIRTSSDCGGDFDSCNRIAIVTSNYLILLSLGIFRCCPCHLNINSTPCFCIISSWWKLTCQLLNTDSGQITRVALGPGSTVFSLFFFGDAVTVGTWGSDEHSFSVTLTVATFSKQIRDTKSVELYHFQYRATTVF